MGKTPPGRAWRRGWLVLLAAWQPGRRLPWPRRWLLRLYALADLPRITSFRVGLLILVAVICLTRALIWHHDIRGALRDAVLVLPVIAWAPLAARLYRWCLLVRLRARRPKLAGAARRCSNSGDEDPVETDLRRARRCRAPGAGRDNRGAAVRGPE